MIFLKENGLRIIWIDQFCAIPLVDFSVSFFATQKDCQNLSDKVDVRDRFSPKNTGLSLTLFDLCKSDFPVAN